jgi:colanic acid/amylovoran biosynthesis protein
MIKENKLVEIRKAGFLNKGAELMLYAVLEKMNQAYPDAVFAMAPSLANPASTPYLKRAELGLYQKADLRRYGVQFGLFANFVPSKVRDMYGIVLDNEIDIVLDAAGFAYSDQWGEGSCSELADSCVRWKKNGTKVVLLPQAFGPYKNKSNLKSIKVAFDHLDMAFARDEVSYKYLVEAVGERPNLKIAPDFTNLIKGVVPENFNRDINQFCIIPNYRMIDKTTKEDSEAYLPFMIEVARYAYQKGQKPFILVHEGRSDLLLAYKIRDAVDQSIQIIKESHPLKIKGILGVSTGVVSSRFHGLVSALSQGTPALATGWSHKYQMLFEEYGFSQGLLNVHTTNNDIHSTMDLIFEKSEDSDIVKTLLLNSIKIKKKSEKMWEDVFKTLQS